MILSGLALLAAAVAAAPATAPAGPPPQRYDVPADAGAQQVIVLERVFAPSGQSGWHTHPGVEIGFVVRGETQMRLADGSVRTFRAGESFLVPRGTVHNGVNVSASPARIILTYVVDKDRPLRTDVAAPVSPRVPE